LQPTPLAFFDAKDKHKGERKTNVDRLDMPHWQIIWFVPVTVALSFERLINDGSLKTLWRECDINGSHGDCSIN